MRVTYDLSKDVPVGGPMSREVADWYVMFTDGQFQAIQHQDGQWYLHILEPADVQADATKATGITHETTRLAPAAAAVVSWLAVPLPHLAGEAQS